MLRDYKGIKLCYRATMAFVVVCFIGLVVCWSVLSVHLLRDKRDSDKEGVPKHQYFCIVWQYAWNRTTLSTTMSALIPPSAWTMIAMSLPILGDSENHGRVYKSETCMCMHISSWDLWLHIKLCLILYSEDLQQIQFKCLKGFSIYIFIYCKHEKTFSLLA